MTFFRSLVVRVLWCLAMPVAAASGQKLTAHSFDLAVQMWAGRAEDRPLSKDRGLALDAVTGWRVREFPHSALIVGVGTTVQGTMAFGKTCYLAPGGCAPNYPSFASMTALGGFEGSFGATLRLLGGPALFVGGTRGIAAGLQGRADLATPSLFHLALVASARGELLPRFEKHEHWLTALGVGIRIQ